MNPKQSKMARAALGWSLTEWAENAGVGRDAAARFEQGNDARVGVSEAVRVKLEAALTNAGAKFSKKGGRVSVSVPE